MKCLKSFLIIANEQKDKNLKYSKSIEKKLLESGASVKLVVGVSADGIRAALDEVEAVIVLGGDGTMLRVSHILVGTGIPVIGVNLGVVGFMTEVVKKDINKMVKRLMAGDYFLEDRMMVTGNVEIKDGKKKNVFTHEALNDVVLARENSLRLITVRIYVNGKKFDTIEADGIIVSTPTGSTSYNLSAGGPIVQPDARLLVMTPISPYSLSSRSVVFGANDKITLKLIEKRKDADNVGLVSFDGTNNHRMTPGDKVTITASPTVFTMIKLEESSVYEILKKKIGN